MQPLGLLPNLEEGTIKQPDHVYNCASQEHSSSCQDLAQAENQQTMLTSLDMRTFEILFKPCWKNKSARPRLQVKSASHNGDHVSQQPPSGPLPHSPEHGTYNVGNARDRQSV